jgi:hypothetical protein
MVNPWWPGEMKSSESFLVDEFCHREASNWDRSGNLIERLAFSQAKIIKEE